MHTFKDPAKSISEGKKLLGLHVQSDAYQIFSKNSNVFKKLIFILIISYK